MIFNGAISKTESKSHEVYPNSGSRIVTIEITTVMDPVTMSEFWKEIYFGRNVEVTTDYKTGKATVKPV